MNIPEFKYVEQQQPEKLNLIEIFCLKFITFFYSVYYLNQGGILYLIPQQPFHPQFSLIIFAQRRFFCIP